MFQKNRNSGILLHECSECISQGECTEGGDGGGVPTFVERIVF